MAEELTHLQESLRYVFVQPELLRLALTHASFGHERRQRAPDNQRLEFLGDAVLQLVVTSDLYRRFPELTEGRLTTLRARLVNRQYLQGLAEQLELGTFLILGRGEKNSQGGVRSSILADAMEAVFGAIYAEAGWEIAREVIARLLAPALAELKPEDPADALNPKGALQEKLQIKGDQPPAYHCLAETGPAHARVYEVVVEWQGRELGRGFGASKKEAETQAAQAALRAV